MKDLFMKGCTVYEIFCRLLLLLMSSMVIIFVFLRYFFGITFVWAEEMITMLFIATTYFGAFLGIRDREHITISLFYDSIPPKIRRYVTIFNHLVILILQLFITRISMQWISKVGNVLTNGMRLPIRYFYYMMPISCVLISLYILFDLGLLILNKGAGKWD